MSKRPSLLVKKAALTTMRLTKNTVARGPEGMHNLSAGDTGQVDFEANKRDIRQNIGVDGWIWFQIDGHSYHVPVDRLEPVEAPKQGSVAEDGYLPELKKADDEDYTTSGGRRQTAIPDGKVLYNGHYLTLKEAANGNLILVATDEFREDPPKDIYAALEDALGNGWTALRPEEVGAITDDNTLILTNDTGYDEATDELNHVGDVWWDEAYAVRDMMEDLETQGFTVMLAAPDNKKQASEASSRVVMGKSNWPESDAEDFKVFAVKPGETDEEAIARARKAYNNPKQEFYIKQASVKTADEATQGLLAAAGEDVLALNGAVVDGCKPGELRSVRDALAEAVFKAEGGKPFMGKEASAKTANDLADAEPLTILQPSLHSMEEFTEILISEAESFGVSQEELVDWNSMKESPDADPQEIQNEILDAIRALGYPVIDEEDSVLIYPKGTILKEASVKTAGPDDEEEFSEEDQAFADGGPTAEQLAEEEAQINGTRNDDPEPDLPEGWSYQFQGYGGSAKKFETKVYAVYDAEDNHFEIRIPMNPKAFPPEKVAVEYHCFSGDTLQDAINDLAESLDGAD